MRVRVEFHETCRTDAKKFLKKFPGLAEELINFEAQLLENPKLGKSLGAGLYKVRLGGKDKGKSGGFRVINYLITEEKEVLIVNVIAIYDKSEEENSHKFTLIKLIKKIGIYFDKDNMPFKSIFLLLLPVVAVVQVGLSQSKQPSSIGITGDTSDVNVPTVNGFVLGGGSTDVKEALLWMIDRAKGGDVIIIRASGSTGYNDFIYGLGGVNSVETLLINSRELAQNPAVANRIRQAELLFIAGGDQGNYVKFWQDTPVEDAINYLIHTKKAPVGGTSAGCAILGEVGFAALNDGINSEEALINPFHPKMTLLKGGFIDIPILKNTITDTHYSNRSRHGRHLTFLARMKTDWKMTAKGIGVDEKTSVCIDEKGIAKVFGSQAAYFIIADSKKPEVCQEGQKLTWNRKMKAVKVYKIMASSTGSGLFDLNNWKPLTEVTRSYWYARDGKEFEN
ncbi:Type 1 glutamine amidotransferase-like domain-containing protein [Runella sp.]|jgi:cyanophycinase|uniref:Type 1 glutamine amidotransferase-like domain-containing protein n=1 Tax=Runella sp. TaxID=1960881 RepID=UPI00301A8F2B